MASTSFNNSSNNSTSTSTSVPNTTQTPQSLFSLQLSQLLSQLGQSEQAWAMQQYANAGQVTDQQINNYISQAQQGNGMATNAIGRYNDLFGPMEDQYARNAGAYDSQGRIQNEMGAAESNAMQAGKQAKDQTEKQLQAFGIDPSSGRYQDLIRASNTADAASAAAAGEQARRAVEAEGDRRRVNAIQMGEQLPASAVNAMNSAYQGIAGAENAELGLLNTGANLTTASSKFFDPATHLTNPVTGQVTNSQSRGNGASNGGSASTTPSPLSGGGSRGGGGGNPSGGGGGGGNSGVLPQPGQQPPLDSFGGVNPTAAIKDINGGGGGEDVGNTNSFGDPIFNPSQSTGFEDSASAWDPSWLQDGINGSNSFGDPTFNQNVQSGNDYGNDFDPSQWGGDSSGGSSGATDYGNTNFGYSDDYAKGGVVGRGQQRPGGGYVPHQMSPSRGRVTDDIPAVIPQTGGRAQINAGEFVLPRDVVEWKGKEFFQKMIQQARKRRMGQAA